LGDTAFLPAEVSAGLLALAVFLAALLLVLLAPPRGVFSAPELLDEVLLGAVFFVTDFFVTDFFATLLLAVVFEAEDLDVDGFFAGLMGRGG
jgi:hypothetical protein